MAEAPSLGDFFKAKSKKKVKASNLNKAEEKKVEDKKKVKATEDDAWEEEQVVASTMKVEVAGKLMREEEKKDDEDTTAPAWGNVSKQKDSASAPGINERRFPTLAKSNASSAINVDDGSDAKVNIATSKNVFAALEGEDEEDGGSKRPKEIKPAMVTKKKGEREKVALQREIDKFSAPAGKKKAKEPRDEDDEDEESDEDAEAEEEEAPVEEEAAKVPEKKEKKAKKPVEEEEEEEEEEAKDIQEDLKMQVNLADSKEKYKGRKKMPSKSLPREELEEEKENKPKQQQASGKKKKFVQEETEKKIAYADWD